MNFFPSGLYTHLPVPTVPRKIIPRTATNTYIRVKTGFFQGMIARVMGVGCSEKCTVRIVGKGQWSGRRTSVVAVNYDPDVTDITEGEEGLIEEDKKEVSNAARVEKAPPLGPILPTADYAGKYVRLKFGLYAGYIGKISMCVSAFPYGVRILDMPGMKSNRHTSCVPSSVDLELNCTQEEAQAIERDKELTAHRARMSSIAATSMHAHALIPIVKQDSAVEIMTSSTNTTLRPSSSSGSYSIPSSSSSSSSSVSSPVHRLPPSSSSASSSSSSSTSAPTSSSSFFSSSSASLTFPTPCTVPNPDGSKNAESFVGKYVRMKSGMFRDAVGRISSQIPRSTSVIASLLRLTLCCCAVLYCAVLCCTVVCCGVVWCGVLCCAVLCCSVLCCAVLCCAVLCCAVLCCAVLR